MRLHLRLAVIRNEIELLENPEMRRVYEEINFNTKPSNDNGSEAKSYIVTSRGTIDKQIEYFNAAKSFIGDDKIVHVVPSLKVSGVHHCPYSLLNFDLIFPPSPVRSA